MDKKLTKKERTFVNEFVATENGTQSALVAYDTEDPTVAAAIAYENLRKPHIQNAVAEALPDEVLGAKHRELLNQVRLDYFVFAKSMSDEEILAHVESVGLKCVNVRPSDRGKLAFFAIPDAQAWAKALEMAYKIKGTYAPDKRVTINLDATSTERTRELGDRLVRLFRRGN